jgi:hypothetical protein
MPTTRNERGQQLVGDGAHVCKPAERVGPHPPSSPAPENRGRSAHRVLDADALPWPGVSDPGAEECRCAEDRLRDDGAPGGTTAVGFTVTTTSAKVD